MPVATELRADPADWSFTSVIREGQEGFSNIDDAAVGVNGSAVVLADRNNVEGVYRIVGGTVTTIAQINQPLSATLGTVSGFPTVGSTARPRLAIDGAGRVLFLATVTGGSLPASEALRGFRWDKGVITLLLPDNGFVPLLDTMADDGRWIAERLTGTRLPIFKEYVVTDGVSTFGSFNFTDSSSTSGCTSSSMQPGHVIAPVGMLLVESTITRRPLSNGTCNVLSDSAEDWTLRIEGSGARTIGSGTHNRGSVSSGTVRPHNYVASATGAVAFMRQNIDPKPLPGSFELFISDEGGTRSILKTNREGEARVLGKVMHLDPFGRASFSMSRTSGGTELYSGPDVARDRVIGRGDRLFGEEVLGVTPMQVVGGGNAFRDNRVFLLFYTLNDAARTFGVAVAQKDVTRWANSAGGSWGEAANWSPAAVPGSTSETLFNLEASYDVTVGTQRAGRALIENGSVGFQSAALTLTGPLHVGGDASLTMPGGTLAAGELIVGHLPPLNLVNEPTARFNASGSAFALTVTGPIVVGEAGRGELFITEGSVSAAELRIGALARGAVAFGLPGTHFVSEGSVAVGDRVPGTLDVERGASMLIGADFVVGRGSSETEPGTGVSRATFRDPFQGNRGLDSLGALRVIVADRLPGRLEILDGAGVGAVGDGSTGPAIITAKTSNPAVFPDASILISGAAGPEAGSGLISLSSVELSVAPGSSTEVVVERGGRFLSSGTVALASGAGSQASVKVTGRGVSGTPSLLDWSGTLSNETISMGVDVGHRGVGVVEVLDGARMKVRNMNIGRFASSRGRVTVGSAGDGTPSQLTVERRGEDFSTGSLTVGGTVLAGTDNDAVGILELDGGEVFVDGAMALGPKGVLRGRGSIIGPAVDMFLAGTVEPGVVLEKEVARAPGGSRTFSAAARTSAEGGASEPVASAAAILAKPTLKLVGKVVLGSTAVVALDIAGSGQADRFAVEGPLTLGGRLELRFANGYAPRAGDTLDLVSSTSVSGAFATTTITGLSPGFEFTLAPNGAGGVRLTAVNDAIASTAVGSRLSNLSVRTPLAEGQNLIVGFVVQGGAKPVLVRAAGPGLARFVGGTHPDPRVTIFDPARAQVDANDSWSSSLAPVMQALGAFAFPSGSADAALQREVATGYTAHVNGPGSGIVLVELYDAQTGVSPRLVNASARNRVGTGANVLIAGFIVDGASPKTLLVRGVGPGLTRFGVDGVLADPLLTLFSQGGIELAANDDWPAELAPTFTRVSAFGLGVGSKDAAMLVTLAPGIYTAQVSGVGATTGEALVEIYEVP
jgi:hypothetical protein